MMKSIIFRKRFFSLWILPALLLLSTLGGLSYGEGETAHISQKWIEVEPGTFVMGSSLTEEDRWENETEHVVKLEHAFGHEGN